MSRHFLTLAKLIANAALASLVVSAMLLGLVLLLNPEISPGILDPVAGFTVFLLAYGLPGAVLFPLMVAAFRFFATRPLKLSWFHLKSAVWFLVAGTGLATLLIYVNLRLGGDLAGAKIRHRLASALVMLVLLWTAAAVAAFQAQIRGGEDADRRRWLALLLLALGAPAIVLAWSLPDRARAAQPWTLPEVVREEGPVMLIGIEGATFAEILPLASEGRLPVFARLLKEGAWGPLATIRPCRSTSAWASLSTGMLPARHAVAGVDRYELAGFDAGLRRLPAGLFMRTWLGPPLLRGRPVSARDLAARPIWEILDLLRVDAAFLGWPLAPAARPRGTEAEAAGRAARAAGFLQHVLPDAKPGDLVPAEADLLRAITEDLEISDAVLRLAASSPPRLAAAFFPGLGLAGSEFLSYARPEEFGVPSEESLERYGHVLDRYYEWLDGRVGELRDALPPDGYLLIVSAYGTEPITWPGRLARALGGVSVPSGAHDDGPAGILMLAGPGVSAGRQVDDLHVTDAVPLVLYLMGLPVGRDMDGRLPRRLFHRSSLGSRPITLISTYGSSPGLD